MLPDDEFRTAVRTVSMEEVDVGALRQLLARASAQQGSDLVQAATIRRRGNSDMVVFVRQLWELRATDIPVQADPTFRISVAVAFCRLDSEQCSDGYAYVRPLLETQDLDVRRASALAIATLGSRDDIGTLRGMIIRDDTAVAQNAATALASIAEADAVPMLRDLIGDPGVSAPKKDILSQTVSAVERRRQALEAQREQ
jgi:hypothetical protein